MAGIYLPGKRRVRVKGVLMRKAAPVKLDLAPFPPSRHVVLLDPVGAPVTPGTLWHFLRDQASWASFSLLSSVTLLNLSNLNCCWNSSVFPQGETENLTFAAEVLSDGSEWIMLLSSSWNSLQSSWEMSRRLPSWVRYLTVPLVGNDCLCGHYNGQFQDKCFCFRKVLIILLQNLII